MKYSDINVYCCPECRGVLHFLDIGESDNVSSPYGEALSSEEVREGCIACDTCHLKYPIIASIPRFTKRKSYASSFGYQWKKFQRTQVTLMQKKISKIRFYRATAWNENLN